MLTPAQLKKFISSDYLKRMIDLSQTENLTSDQLKCLYRKQYENYPNDTTVIKQFEINLVHAYLRFQTSSDKLQESEDKRCFKSSTIVFINACCMDVIKDIAAPVVIKLVTLLLYINMNIKYFQFSCDETILNGIEVFLRHKMDFANEHLKILENELQDIQVINQVYRAHPPESRQQRVIVFNLIQALKIIARYSEYIPKTLGFVMGEKYDPFTVSLSSRSAVLTQRVTKLPDQMIYFTSDRDIVLKLLEYKKVCINNDNNISQSDVSNVLSDLYRELIANLHNPEHDLIYAYLIFHNLCYKPIVPGSPITNKSIADIHAMCCNIIINNHAEVITRAAAILLYLKANMWTGHLVFELSLLHGVESILNTLNHEDERVQMLQAEYMEISRDTILNKPSEQVQGNMIPLVVALAQFSHFPNVYIPSSLKPIYDLCLSNLHGSFFQARPETHITMPPVMHPPHTMLEGVLSYPMQGTKIR